MLLCIVGLIKCENESTTSNLSKDTPEHTIIEANHKVLLQNKLQKDDIQIMGDAAMATHAKFAPHTLAEGKSDKVQDVKDMTTSTSEYDLINDVAMTEETSSEPIEDITISPDYMEVFTISHETIMNTDISEELTAMVYTENPLDVSSALRNPHDYVSNFILDNQQSSVTSTIIDILDSDTTLESVKTTQSTITTTTETTEVNNPIIKTRSSTTVIPTIETEKVYSANISPARLTADEDSSPSSPTSPVQTSFGTMVLAVIVIATVICYMIVFLAGVVMVEWRKNNLKKLNPETVSPPSLDDVDGPTGYSNPTFEMT